MPSGELPPSSSTVASVAALEKATGISSATLRVWERRYGFPSPQRNARGGRVYHASQVNKLRLIARLLSLGGRPGDLVLQTAGELQERLDAAYATFTLAADPMLRLLKAMDPAGVFKQLLQQLALLGLERFVCEVVARTNTVVGEAWACGQLEPCEEHLYTESVQQVLRAAIAGLPAVDNAGKPRVLLATPAGEQHGLGLLMVEALLTKEQCPCLPLGRSLSAEQVALASGKWNADIVGVSATGALPARSVLDFVQRLRAALPPQVVIWAGGSSKALRRAEVSAIAGLRVFGHVDEVIGAVAGLRGRA